jgi:hypothetical protein
MIRAIPHLEQRSAEWFAVRQGRPTASDAKFIITPAKAVLSAQRHDYIDALLAELYIPAGHLDDESELYTGRKFFGNRFTDHGNQFEEEAIEDFSDKHQLQVFPVGFVIAADGLFGLSPDGACGDADWINEAGHLNWGLEVKCKCLKNHIRTVRENTVPEEHLGQVHFSLAKTGAEVWFYHSYFPGVKSHTIEVRRNDYTKRAEDALGQFMDDYKAARAKLVPMLNLDEESPEPEMEEVA